LYRLAAETGLRVSELHSLTASSFDFSDNTVCVEDDDTKNRKGAVLPLKPDILGKLPQAPAFNMPSKARVSDMIKKDLEAAGIDPWQSAGRRWCASESCSGFDAAQ